MINKLESCRVISDGREAILKAMAVLEVPLLGSVSWWVGSHYSQIRELPTETLLFPAHNNYANSRAVGYNVKINSLYIYICCFFITIFKSIFI